jgi:hypothetical protein
MALSEREIWTLLERGGCSVADADDSRERRALRGSYSALPDPTGAERLSELVGERARSLRPTVVVVWEEIEDLLIGFLVARALELPVVRAIDAEGLARSQGAFPERPRAVLVGVAFRSERPILAARALVEQHGGELVGVLALVRGEPPGPALVVNALVELDAGSGP